MQKLKQFFKISKYEIIRVARNKVVCTMLLVFSIALLLILSYVQINTKQFPIAIYTDGVNLEEEGVVELIKYNLQAGKIIYVDNEQEGIELVNKNKVCFFICLDKGEDKDQTTAVFYYDQSNTVGRTVASNLSEAKNEYAYNATTTFLSKYGITLNETYFQAISFKPANNNAINIKQMPFAIEISCCISIILMLGLAYSVSRDNETQVSKNINYIPMGANRYLLSKLLPYFALGIIEIAIMFFLGQHLFDIQFQTNIFLMILLSLFGVMSVLSLGLLFSLFKSQISTVFLDMLTILLPLFVSIVVYVQACPTYIQVILNIVPITSFITFLNCMMYNGVILWQYIPIFLAQAIVYYLLSLLIVKYRAKQ